MKQRGSGGILLAMGHTAHAQQLNCDVSGLGNQILRASNMPECCNFEGNGVSSHFLSLIMENQKISLFSYFFFLNENYLGYD